jgi:hypothetical protein
MPRTFAYLRMSTTGQTTDNQLQEIKAASRINSPWRDPACSSGPICRLVNDGRRGLVGAGSGPAV